MFPVFGRTNSRVAQRQWCFIQKKGIIQKHHVVPLLWTIAKLIQFTFSPSIYFSIHFMGIATGCRMRFLRTSFFSKLFWARTRKNDEGGERKSIHTTLTHSHSQDARYRKIILAAINWLEFRFRYSLIHIAIIIRIIPLWHSILSEHIYVKRKDVWYSSQSQNEREKEREKNVKMNEMEENAESIVRIIFSKAMGRRLVWWIQFNSEWI